MASAKAVVQVSVTAAEEPALMEPVETRACLKPLPLAAIPVLIVGELRVLLVRVCVSVVPTSEPAGASCPSSLSALRLATSVVEETARGAVPVVTVEMSCVPWTVPAL